MTTGRANAGAKPIDGIPWLALAGRLDSRAGMRTGGLVGPVCEPVDLSGRPANRELLAVAERDGSDQAALRADEIVATESADHPTGFEGMLRLGEMSVGHRKQ